MPRKKRKLSADFPLHITGRSNNRDHFPIPLSEVWSICEDYLFLVSKGFEIEILSFVLMPNHFHLIVRDPHLNLIKAMQYFMRETSKEICRASNRINRIWGGEYHSTVIDSLEYYFICYRYVYRNPVSANICRAVTDYPYSTLSMLCGKIGGAIPLKNDETLMNSPENTLAWLNKSYEGTEQDDIRKSLRRATMKLPVKRTSRRRTKL